MSLEKLEATDGEVRILANSGDLALVFPRELWESMLTEVSSSEPAPRSSKNSKLSSGGSRSTPGRTRSPPYSKRCRSADRPADRPAGRQATRTQKGSSISCLRPAGMFAATTGYVFLPVVRPEHVTLFGAQLDEDDFVEQAYLVGAVTDRRALAAGDESLKALSIRGEGVQLQPLRARARTLAGPLGEAWMEQRRTRRAGGPLGADHGNEG